MPYDIFGFKLSWQMGYDLGDHIMLQGTQVHRERTFLEGGDL